MADGESEVTLDRVLLGLQKSISRVNRDSASVEGARALIVGDLEFSLSVSGDYADGDRIAVRPDGAIRLTLSGTINADVRVQRVEGDGDGAGSGGA